QVAQAPSQPVESPHHQGIALAQSLQAAVQLGPGGVPSAGVLFVRVATFGAFQRVALQIQGLIVRRDTGIADSHGAKPFRWYRSRIIDFAIVFATDLSAQWQRFSRCGECRINRGFWDAILSKWKLRPT